MVLPGMAMKRPADHAKKLKKDILAVYYAYRHPGTGRLPKIVILFTLGYALSPIDLIPDFIPVLGYLDDLIILPALISISIRLIPDAVMEQSRIRAENEPLKMKKNWFFAAGFVLIWLILIAALISAAAGFR